MSIDSCIGTLWYTDSGTPCRAAIGDQPGDPWRADGFGRWLGRTEGGPAAARQPKELRDARDAPAISEDVKKEKLKSC